ncbi:DUF5017 domain-containing protein [Flavobacterium sp.]|uniref:DUF5017 domain-containing protein n=1 Tax=Flavobacterium sp. TaxID=239 RepID=UPI00286E80D7|nr:DUF5017 domain-containing protein [Flavobacterium sp.]
MQTNKILSLVGCFIFLLLTACSPEDDIKNPNFSPLIFSEDFSKGAVDDAVLNLENWNNIAEVGTVQWKTQVFSGNPYAEFSSFKSPDSENVGWLISPSINMDAATGEVLQFEASQSFVTSSGNSLEVLIATDYNGTNLTTANWQPIDANLPTASSAYFEFLKSGEIDLSNYTGNIYIAFKVKGSGTNSSLDGSYQVDSIRIYTKN